LKTHSLSGIVTSKVKKENKLSSVNSPGYRQAAAEGARGDQLKEGNPRTKHKILPDETSCRGDGLQLGVRSPVAAVFRQEEGVRRGSHVMANHLCPPPPPSPSPTTTAAATTVMSSGP